jgi:CheY-like chemotaxis protein
VEEYRKEIATERRYEIVLMDYQLHESSNGLELLNHYQVVTSQPFLGVLITAEQDPQVEKAALQAGFQFLAKPVEPAKLRSVLHTAMLARQQAREEASP